MKLGEVSLEQAQRAKASQLLRNFLSSGATVHNQGIEISFKDFDKKRIQALPELSESLQEFVNGLTDLKQFKEHSEILCRRHDYWGFKNFSGQMVLNELANWSDSSPVMAERLRQWFRVPKDKQAAGSVIQRMIAESSTLLPAGKKIRAGSVPYFLSYFWQLQAPKMIPICYSSSRHTLSDEGFLEDDMEEPGAYFQRFWDIFDLLAELYSNETDLTAINRYWFVEHVLWAEHQRTQQAKRDESQSKPPEAKTSQKRRASLNPDYLQYIPHVLGNFVSLSAGEGDSLDFEQKVISLFKMLGFQVESLGQGSGRQPDGIARCREYNYAVLFDAKSAQEGYAIGTQDRAIIEYIKSHERRLLKDGYQQLYFVIVSSGFPSDSARAIDRIRKETSARSVVLMVAAQGLRLLAKKIEDPLAFDLGDFRDLLLESGELEEEKLDEFLGV